MAYLRHYFYIGFLAYLALLLLYLICRWKIGKNYKDGEYQNEDQRNAEE
jgi:hypothetical protein